MNPASSEYGSSRAEYETPTEDIVDTLRHANTPWSRRAAKAIVTLRTEVLRLREELRERDLDRRFGRRG